MMSGFFVYLCRDQISFVLIRFWVDPGIMSGFFLLKCLEITKL